MERTPIKWTDDLRAELGRRYLTGEARITIARSLSYKNDLMIATELRRFVARYTGVSRWQRVDDLRAANALPAALSEFEKTPASDFRRRTGSLSTLAQTLLRHTHCVSDDDVRRVGRIGFKNEGGVPLKTLEEIGELIGGWPVEPPPHPKPPPYSRALSRIPEDAIVAELRRRGYRVEKP
jgi:hypothetical protein